MIEDSVKGEIIRKLIYRCKKEEKARNRKTDPRCKSTCVFYGNIEIKESKLRAMINVCLLYRCHIIQFKNK